MLAGCFQACARGPVQIADPLGMYLYVGINRVSMDGSYSRQIVEEIEFNGSNYGIQITDYKYRNDYFYFCGEFDNNKQFGVFRYCFVERSVESFFIKQIPQDGSWTGRWISAITNHFVLLRDAYPWSEVFHAIGYCGNLLDIPNVGVGVYGNEVRVVLSQNGNLSTVFIECLITFEAIELPTITTSHMHHNWPAILRFHECVNFFMIYIIYSQAQRNWQRVIVYDDGTVYDDFWSINGSTVDHVNSVGKLLFQYSTPFANHPTSETNSIYQFVRGEGFKRLHSISQSHFLEPIHRGGTLFYNRWTLSTEAVTSHAFDLHTGAHIDRTMALNKQNIFSLHQRYFNGFIFYTRSRSLGMWAGMRVYLHRVNLSTGANEIVGYRNDEFPINRIDF